MKTTSNHLINRFVRRFSLAMATLLLAGATVLAQSTDRDNPTPLAANEITDDFHQNDPEMFYQFVAGPGAVDFTLDLRARNYGGAFYVTLFDARNHELAAFDGVVLKGESKRITKRVEFVKTMPVLMRLYSGNGQGSYRLRLDGPIGTGQINANPQVVTGAAVSGGIATTGQIADPSTPSTDRDNPTPLQSNDISDDFHSDDPEYFYGFVAGPGALTFTLDLKARNYGGAFYVTLFDQRGRQLAAFDGVVLKGESKRITRQVSFPKETTVIMRLYSGNGQGTYHLHIEDSAAHAVGNYLPQAEPLPGSSQTSTSVEASTTSTTVTPQITTRIGQSLRFGRAAAVRTILRRLPQ